MKLWVHRYESVPAFCDFIEVSRERLRAPALIDGRSVSVALAGLRTLGGVSSDDRFQIRSWVEEAGRRIDASFDRPKRVWMEGPMGAYPIVPEVLNGHPFCMRQLSAAPFEQSPMHIVVDASAAVGVDASLCFERSIAIAALISRLQETRPVEVSVCFAGLVSMGRDEVANQMVLVALNASEWMNEIVYLAADRSFPGCLGPMAAMVQAGCSFNTGIGPLWGFYQREDRYALKVRDAMGLAHTDLYIPPARLSEVQSLLADPVSWLGELVKEQEAA